VDSRRLGSRFSVALWQCLVAKRKVWLNVSAGHSPAGRIRSTLDTPNHISPCVQLPCQTSVPGISSQWFPCSFYASRSLRDLGYAVTTTSHNHCSLTIGSRTKLLAVEARAISPVMDPSVIYGYSSLLRNEWSMLGFEDPSVTTMVQRLAHRWAPV
jgi:hypothetical protein